MPGTRAPGGGRKRIPTAIHILRGNPGKRPLPSDEPKPKVRPLPSAPVFLSAEAKKEWRRTGRKLLTLGLVTEIDVTALSAYCQVWARWVDAEQKLNEYGAVIKAGNELVQSPYLKVANEAMVQMVRMLVEFGMTPSSRSRVKVEKRDASNSEDEAFFGPRVPA